MKQLALAVAATLVLCGATSAVARDARTEQVRFAAGASGTSIRDSITGYESVDYKVGAEAGHQGVRADAASDRIVAGRSRLCG